MDKRILTPDQRLRVFVSSALQELAEERAAVKEAVTRLRLSPVLFELGARPHPPQELYRAYLAQSDIFIGIYWQSYGWVGPGMEISGLKDEFQQSEGMPRLIYIKTPAPQREPQLTEFLDRIRDSGGVCYKHFSTPTELAGLVQNDLALLLTEGFAESRFGAGPTAAKLGSALAQNVVTPAQLPIPPTAIFGREQELETIADLFLRPHVRLLTLTGPGGSGKTRLALEAAHLVAAHFLDGVVFVNLSALQDPGLVVSTITAAFGLPEAPGGRPEDALVAYLAPRHLLLVIDNFEHVLDAATLVGVFLEAAPNLKIFATSRIPLRLRGETEFPVGPLGCPPSGQAIDPSQVEDFPALKLFLERSRAARLDYSLTETNIDAMSQICRRLDGLPLALELAAARSRLLSPRELLERLQTGFDVLAANIRDLPERQRTLGATIDWSYQLLSEPARTLFRQLSVFAGGWTLQAMETVCAAKDEGIDVVGEMEALLEASLIQRREVPGRGVRFTMLQTVREFAGRMLEAAGQEEKAATSQRHASWVLEVAGQASRGLRSAGRVEWARRLDAELDNVRAALAWAGSTSGEVEVGISIMWRLAWFFETRGEASEALFWSESLGPRVDDQLQPGLRVRWLLTQLLMHYVGRNGPGMLDSLSKAYAALEAVDDPEALAAALTFEGMVLTTTERDDARALEVLRRAITICERLGLDWEIGFACYWLCCALLGSDDADQPWQANQRSLETFRKTGDPWGVGVSLHNQSLLELRRHDLTAARRSMEESVRLLRLAEDAWSVPWATGSLGMVLLLGERPQEADGHFREALVLGRDYSNPSGITLGLAGLAGVAVTCSPCDGEHGPDLRRAARLLGAAAARTASIAVKPWPGWDEVMARLESLVKPRLDETSWETEQAAGRRLSQEEALAYAMSDASLERDETQIEEAAR